MVDDLLCESQIRNRGLFKPEDVQKFVKEHRNGAQDWSMQIWQFLTLELWMQTFFNGRTKSSVDQNFHPRQVATA